MCIKFRVIFLKYILSAFQLEGYLEARLWNEIFIWTQNQVHTLYAYGWKKNVAMAYVQRWEKLH